MLIREAIFGLLRDRGIRRIYGNPGSTELSLLSGLPDDIDYILALHEHTAVAAAAGEAVLTGQPTFVNLHTLAGLANGSGGMTAAVANRAPVVITAGQQHTGHLRTDPLLSGPMVEFAMPLTKRSSQPARAADVPMEIERAFRLAMTPPRGPVFVSLPMDFMEEVAEGPVEVRPVQVGAELGATALSELVADLVGARAPAIVTSAAVETYGGFDAAIELADAIDARVYAAPMTARFGFPTGHSRFSGQLLPDAGGIHKRLSEHDVVLVAGGPAFVLYPFRDHPVVPSTTRAILLSESPDDLARYEWGPSYLVDVGAALRAVVAQLPPGDGAAATVIPPTDGVAAESMSGTVVPGATLELDVTTVCAALRDILPSDFCLMDESISNGPALRAALPVDRPNRYLRSSHGGLGSALPAAIGAALADPSRPVVVATGDGSLLYSPQALWTMANHRLPVIVVVLNNASYRILQDFHRNNYVHLGEMVTSDLGGIDPCRIAEGFGLPAHCVATATELRAAVTDVLNSGGPGLIDVKLTSASPSMFD